MEEFNNQDILDYLMTSDFTEELTQAELKALLLKFREFYRIHHSINNNKLGDRDFQIKKLTEEMEFIRNEKYMAIKELDETNNELKKIVDRKLSLWERIIGKISIN